MNTKSTFPLLGWIIWICGIIFYLYEFFLRTFVGTLAKSIIADIHLTSELFALMGAGYYIAYAIMQVPVGFLTDKFGAKKIIIGALIACGLSVISFALSDNFFMAFFSRILMGFGSSFGFVSLLVIIANWFPQKSHATFIGASSFLGTIGPLLAGGPLATLVSKSSVSWRIIFIYVGLFGFAFALLSFFSIRNKPRSFKSKVVKIEKGYSFKKLIKMLLKNQQVWFIGTFSAIMYEIIDFLGAIWGTFYLQSRGLSLSEAGYTISSGWLGYAVGCLLLVICSHKIRRRKPVLIFSNILGLICILINNYFPIEHPYAYIYLILYFFIGISASAQSLGIAVILEHVEPPIKALALGFNNGLIILFAAMIPIVSSAFIHLPKEGAPMPENFIMGFSILPIILCVSLLISIFCINETFCRPQRQPVFLNNPK